MNATFTYGMIYKYRAYNKLRSFPIEVIDSIELKKYNQ